MCVGGVDTINKIKKKLLKEEKCSNLTKTHKLFFKIPQKQMQFFKYKNERKSFQWELPQINPNPKALFLI